MIKIGLTGGIAAGKSTVCELFSQLDIPIIDADIIARQLVEPGQIALSEIIATFGIEILNKEGSLDRAKLRQLIFSDPSAKQQLEQILHPKIRSELKRQSDRVKADYCILAIPLLIETHWQNSVDRILVVDIDQQAQIERLCSRDQIAISEAEKIIKSQSSADQRLSYADDVIENNLSADFLKEQVLSLDSKYRLMANKQSTTCQSLNSQRQY